MPEKKAKKRRHYGLKRTSPLPLRLRILQGLVVVVSLLLLMRLGYIQIWQHGLYDALASGQRELYQELIPERGEVFVTDPDGSEIAIATNRYLNLVWADVRRIDDPVRTARVLSEILELDKIDEDEEEDAGTSPDLSTLDLSEEQVEEAEPISPTAEHDALLKKLQKENDPYEPIKRKVSDDMADEVRQANLEGIHILRERFRYYPESEEFSHITGFVNANDDGVLVGSYGLEGSMNKELSGTGGYLMSELDTKGRWISIGTRNMEDATDGSDILLTVDRTIQFMACSKLQEAVDKHDADGGSVVIMDPKTGGILAMCGSPKYDPNLYNEVESIEVYNNQAIFEAYEPGSIFKPIVMAAAMDSGAVDPNTTYIDTGAEKIDRYTIRNSDLKSYGEQNMTQVLEESLNTGMIFVMRAMGGPQMAKYIRDFGFGETTDISLNTEVAGNLQSLDRDSEIYYATNSYGQGLTVTALQAVAAYAVIANGGAYIPPHVIKEIRHDDGSVDVTSNMAKRQVISSKTAQTLSAMLISVIDNGHAKSAGVDGYYIAGKTGTAQVAKKNGVGYERDETIASFVGYGPVEDPRFAMIVRIDHPRTTPWAAGTAAPAFGEIASFLLQYMNIPPER